jgi:hypothetical protein
VNNILEPHVVADNAGKILGWMRDRGGICIWPSVNLSNPNGSWTTPRLDEAGVAVQKPTWQASNTPRVITDLGEVLVVRDVEVRRFRVGIRRAQFSFKVTDGGSRKIRSAVAKAGLGAYHTFCYENQQAVIMKPEGAAIPLAAWAA